MESPWFNGHLAINVSHFSPVQPWLSVINFSPVQPWLSGINLARYSHG